MSEKGIAKDFSTHHSEGDGDSTLGLVFSEDISED
jgi:hypothetical protein